MLNLTRTDIEKLNVNPELILGSGTHGIVYQSSFSENIAIKVVKNESVQYVYCDKDELKQEESSTCYLLKDKEYTISEIIHDNLSSFMKFFDEDVKETIIIPSTRGTSYSPSYDNKIFCSYMIDRIYPPHQYPPYLSNSIVQLSYFNDRDYFSMEQSGIYLGADKIIEEFGKNESDLYVKCMGSLHAYLHYGLYCDGFDAEYVLCDINGNVKVCMLDFDKVSFYDGKYKNISVRDTCIARKIAENQYDKRSIKDRSNIIRLLATSFTYDPHPSYPEYKIWEEAYIEVADRINGSGDFARDVLKMRSRFTA